MNNSNNMFDNNGMTPSQPNNIPNGNMTPPSYPNETSTNQNVAPIQQQSNNSNQPSNNPISNDINGMNSTIINPIPNQGSPVVNPTPVIQPINPQQNQNFSNVGQNYAPNTNFNDDELLRAFIGNNYEKITTRPFNFAGFFFTSLYMFYRKMFLYGILLFIVSLLISNFIIKNVFIVSVLLGIVVGFLVNKVYLYYAKKQINKIKSENPQKSNEELKNICSTKGGTSTGKVFLGFFIQVGIALVAIIIMMFMGFSSFVGELFNPNNWDITINGSPIQSNGDDTNSFNSSTTGTLIENVIVSGYSCFGSECTISIEDSNGSTTNYMMNANDGELFKTLGNYKDYIKVNIYYTSKGDEKTISNYKIYLKSNNEDISSIQTESELRDKIGLYSLGTHTDIFMLKKVGTTGFEFKDDVSYTYTTYTFVDSKNIEYEMKYINSNGTLNLAEGNQYTVTFEVTQGMFDYEFNIKSIS